MLYNYGNKLININNVIYVEKNKKKLFFKTILDDLLKYSYKQLSIQIK